MEIRIAAVPPEGLTLLVDREAREFPELRAMAERGEVAFTAPITGRLAVTPREGLFEVRGQLESRMELPCSRCLEVLQVPLAVSFAATFALEPPGGGAETEGEQELEADEMGLDWIRGEALDLRTAIQEQVLLAIPLQPVCRPDCRGLCSRCGKSLNAGPCGCEPAEPDPRWAALRRLKLPS
jgi:uncharacterized protein